MNIYILRHGIAVERENWKALDDSVRPLTPKGKRQLKKSAVAMIKMKLRFDLILSSPFERAKKTAEIVAKELNLKARLKFSDELQPDGNVKNLIRQLGESRAKNVLLVGHEPYLSGLISLLVSGGGNLAMDFKKGGVCKLEIEKLHFGPCAQLAWLLTPKQMKLMK